MAFTRFPDPTNNISNLANQPVESAAVLKQKFDQIGEDLKDWNNNMFLPELESTTDGDSGIDNIGMTPIAGYTNPQTMMEHLEADKTPLTGNHLGTWQGFNPVQTDPGIQAIVNEHTIQLVDIVTLIKPTGTGNDSANINTLLQVGGTFKVTKGIYNIVEDIIVKSNTKIIFENGSILKRVATSLEVYNVIYLRNVDNIVIEYPHIIGDKDTHIGITGEYGHGITILHCDNVTITEPKIFDCWGDGIYIGIDFYGVNNKINDNIKILRPYVDGVRRNGISVCSGGVIEIIDPIIKNVLGTNPKAGIDIEPESQDNSPYLENLKIIRPITENCGLGITGFLASLDGKESNILIERHVDSGSTNGFVLFNCQANVRGSVMYRDCVLKNNFAVPLIVNQYGLNMPTLFISNPTIINSNVANNANEAFSSAILLPSAISTTGDIGNIEIEGLTVIDTRTPKLINYSVNLRHANLKNVKLINPKRLDTVLLQVYMSGNNTNVYDDLGILAIEDTFGGGISVSEYGIHSKRRNTNATVWIYYTLSQMKVDSPITFEMTSAQSMVITPPSGKSIFPIAAIGQSIRSTVKGSKITLRPLDSGDWTVDNIVGTWVIL